MEFFLNKNVHNLTTNRIVWGQNMDQVVKFDQPTFTFLTYFYKNTEREKERKREREKERNREREK